MSNRVVLTNTEQVVVTEVAEQAIEVRTPAESLLVEIHTAGPQGSVAPLYELSDLRDVNIGGKVAGSVLYYDQASSKWKGDDINTITTLTDGGNFAVVAPLLLLLLLL